MQNHTWVKVSTEVPARLADCLTEENSKSWFIFTYCN